MVVAAVGHSSLDDGALAPWCTGYSSIKLIIRRRPFCDLYGI